LNLGIGFAIITGVVLRFQRDSIFAWSGSYGWRPFEFSTRIDFNAPATLRKWPSVNKERVSASRGARPYMFIKGTLNECIQQFMLQPEAQHHLYEIHTAPQSDLVGAILSTDHVVELARPRHFLGKFKEDGPLATPEAAERKLRLERAHCSQKAIILSLDSALKPAKRPSALTAIAVPLGSAQEYTPSTPRPIE